MIRTIPFTQATLLSVNTDDNTVSEKIVKYDKIVSESKIKKDYPNAIIKSVEKLQQTYELSDELFLQYATIVGEPTTFVGRKRSKTTE